MTAKATLVGIDTSIVLRLLVGEPESQAKKAIALLDKFTRENKQAAVSDIVISETYFALQYHYKVPKARALNTLHEFLSSGEIVALGVAPKVLEHANLASANPGFADRLIHEDYIAKCEGMASFEKAAKKLTATEVL